MLGHSLERSGRCDKRGEVLVPAVAQPLPAAVLLGDDVVRDVVDEVEDV